MTTRRARGDRPQEDVSPPPVPAAGSAREVFSAFLRLGLTSFGGPIAHLGYFRAELVERRRWVDEGTYADLVALCQLLPGPASSQVGMALGLSRAGVRGALAAWLGFTLPSALTLVGFAYGVDRVGGVAGSGWVHGLEVVAVAVVAQAVWGMARSLCPDRPRATIAILAAVTSLLWVAALGQVLTIAVAGLIGWRLLPRAAVPAAPTLPVPFGRRAGAACLSLFGLLLAAMPLADRLVGGRTVALVDGLYRSGALVFGGGHVVLPLLRTEVVPPGWVTDQQFVAGYGATQAVPGPLFAFSAYLGALTSGPVGAALALVAIFLPALLLILGTLPFWDAIRARTGVRSALGGVNAAVVGVLLAALYDPVWTSAIIAAEDLALALTAFGLLVLWRLPHWLVVLLTALAGEALSRV